jgi:hypothetical protein
MRKLIAILAVVLWSGIAAAQHSHGSMKGPNGGTMQDIVGVHAELLISGNVVTINVLDESNKTTSAKGFSGSVLIVSGASRETVQLQAGETALKGESKVPLVAGATVTLVLKNAAGKSGQVKF